MTSLGVVIKWHLVTWCASGCDHVPANGLLYMILWGDFPEVLRALYNAQNGICPYCGKRLSTSRRGLRRRATIDHVTPRARGGRAAPENEVLAHAGCNFAKANRAPFPCELLFAAITYERLSRSCDLREQEDGKSPGTIFRRVPQDPIVG